MKFVLGWLMPTKQYPVEAERVRLGIFFGKHALRRVFCLCSEVERGVKLFFTVANAVKLRYNC